MFQDATIGILLVDSKGIIVQVNDFTMQLFGYNKKELIGLNVDMLLPAALRKAHTKHRIAYQHTPNARAMGKGLNLQASRKDGSVFPVEISLGHTHIENTLHIIAYITDITERQQMETALENYQTRLLNYTEELEVRIIQRTEELEKALQKEKELGALKSRFVSLASHEFRTPLSSILASAELLEHYLENGKRAKGEKNINRIKTSVQHLTSILNDFLNVEKLEAGKIRIQLSPTIISIWLKEVMEEIEPIFKEGQSIIVSQNTPATLYLDAYHLKIILLNLLSNASKYSAINQPIHLAINQLAGALQIVVTDKGVGIPLPEQSGLFSRFFRASNVENIQGTGLGLNIVKQYTELMDGTIDFESKEGEGSRFVVTIPLRK